MTKQKKTEQEKEGEGLLRKLFKGLVDKKIEIRSSYENDELGRDGDKRVIIFYKEKRK